MLVTIFSDASRCHRTGAAGWAAWAKSARGSMRYHASFSEPQETSNFAEAKAVINAIYVTIKARVAEPGDRLLIQTDSQTAIHYFTGVARRGRKKREHIVRKFRAITKGFEVEFRHVPGHAGNGTKRSAVNEMCDKAARAAMLRARENFASQVAA